MSKKNSPPNPFEPLQKKGILLLKFLLVVGLLTFLAKRGFISIQATHQALQQWQKIVPAIGLLFCCTFLGVSRWKWLLEAHQIHLSWGRVFQLTMVGNFFNIALPGAVSGDFIKAFYIGKEMKGHKSKAFGSILFDRVAGVSALVLVSAGALAAGLTSFLNSPLFSAIQVLIELAATCVILFYTYLFLVREKGDPLLRFFRSLEKKCTPIGTLTRIYALSVLIHLVTGWSCLTFAQALGDSNLPLLAAYVVVPLGLLVTAVPIAPAGIGTGNIAFLYFFHLIGSERGADIFSLYALTNIFIGAIGGLIYFRFKSHIKVT